MLTCFRNILFFLTGVSLSLLTADSAFAKPPSLIEIKTSSDVYLGKSIAHNHDVSWMMDQAGMLSEIPLKKVTSFRRVAAEFQRLPLNKMKLQLQNEFGPFFEVISTRHYLICAPRGKAKAYGGVFEDLYQSFSHYFSLRGYQVKSPEFLMVTIIFPDRTQFYDYCKKDGVRTSQGLLGYYHPHSNRTALFDQSTATKSVSIEQDREENEFTYSRLSTSGKNLTEALRDTMIHEATHQVAFNTGLHSRVGENPRWVVEGLATTFESDDLRTHTGGRGKSISRINRNRLLWFANYAQNRRKKNSLQSFIREDKLFQSSTFDAYAEAWALTFFLVETQPARYARYLKKISQRDPLKEYPAESRERDFKEVFKTNLKSLEVDYLTFIDQLTQELSRQN
ncbi:MAG: DUF1570 domain-containing protein [Planctomycetes bacterium]|nr:DUF1570 domain-containing protein [Planctomycetota bacterium]MCH9727482.1 DUF1570 domain-containing protein [Planctomycetota bacterium]MCH9775987.1 DUF1570 domain-containing protein [Planctomycetota bacterium]MCH9789484.1 DUF1570 domain-containing protein [Planctomycetota bacterium]